MKRSALIGAALILSLSLSACLQPQTLLRIPLAAGLEGLVLVDNARAPQALALARDGRIFYAERTTGRVRVLSGGVLSPTPVTDVAVNFAGARGLLGLALDPEFAANGRIFLFYTLSDTGRDTDDPRALVDNRVVSFIVGADNVATGAESFVASLPPDLTAENLGGRIGFARDGTLYVLFGEGGSPDSVQDLTSRYGKILRYNPDGTIPADNPDPASPVVARGVRNPTGLAFDVASDQIYFLDQQSDTTSEINRIVPGGDYGWPNATGVTAAGGDIDPILVTTNATRPFAGAAVDPFGQYGVDTFGQLLVGEADDGQIIAVTLAGGRLAVTGESAFATGVPDPITDLQFNTAGTLFIATQTQIIQVNRTAN